jgi:hypothetical protein
MVWINMNTKRVLASRETKGVKTSTTKSQTNKIITYKLPVALKNITGMIPGDAGELYGVSANSRPIIIKFDTAARVDKLIKVNGVPNLSWSDAATAGNGYVYIADTGNENFKRKFFQVYKVRYDDMKNFEAIDAIKFEFTLPDGLSLDLRTLFVIGTDIYLLGADQSKTNMLLRIEEKDEQQVASVITRCDNLKQFAITSSLYDAVRKQLTILDGEKLGIIDLSGGIATISKKQPSIIRLAFKSKKEAMTESGGRLLLADQPAVGATVGNIYSVPRQ